jgi:hypothetical protein
MTSLYQKIAQMAIVLVLHKRKPLGKTMRLGK